MEEERGGDKGLNVSEIEIEVESSLSRVNGLEVNEVKVKIGPVPVKVGFVDCRGLGFEEVLGRALLAKRGGGYDKVVVVAGGDVAKSVNSLGVGWLVAIEEREVKEIVPVTAKKPAKKFYVSPSLTVEKVSEISERLRGGLLRRVVNVLGDFVGARLAFMPLYCSVIHAHSIDYTPSPLEMETVTLCFELQTGSLVTFGDGLRTANFWQKIGELGSESIEVLKLIAEMGEAGIPDLKEKLGDKVDVDSVIEVLMERGLIRQKSPETYSLAPLPTSRIRDVVSSLEGRLIKGEPSCGYVFKAHVDVSKINSVLRLYGNVKDEQLVYYPLVVMLYRRSVERRKIEMTVIVDGVEGSRLGEMEELIAESPAVTETDLIADDILKRGGIELCQA